MLQPFERACILSALEIRHAERDVDFRIVGVLRERLLHLRHADRRRAWSAPRASTCRSRCRLAAADAAAQPGQQHGQDAQARGYPCWPLIRPAAPLPDAEHLHAASSQTDANHNVRLPQERLLLVVHGASERSARSALRASARSRRSASREGGSVYRGLGWLHGASERCERATRAERAGEAARERSV